MKLAADGKDLSFITATIQDANGNMIPNADNLINFQLTGDAEIAGVDNGSPTSMEPFKANYRKAFNGLALAIIQAKEKAGKVTLKASAEGLQSAVIELQVK